MDEFYKYNDNPTVYRSGDNTAFSTPDEFFAAGGARDYSNVKIQVRPVISSDSARTATTQNVSSLVKSEQSLPFYRYADNPTVYSSSGQAFSSPDQFYQAGGARDYSNVQTIARNPAQQQLEQKIAQRASAVGDQDSLDALQNVNDKELSLLADARNAADVKDYRNLNSLMKQLEQSRAERSGLLKQISDKTKLTEDEIKYRKRLSDIETQERNTALSAQAGINDIESKPIPMSFITGESAQIMKQANLQLQTLAAQKIPVIDQLQLASEIRQQALQGLQFALESNSDDANFIFKMMDTAREIEAIQKQEQAVAKQFALENQINTPFYNVGGTIYRTADGKAYSNPDEFFADGGAKDYSNAPVIDTGSREEKALVLDLASKYFDAGISPGDSLAVAQSKAKTSKIYADQIRGPVGSGGGGSGGVLGLTNTQIDNISPLVSQFQSSPIVQNYNTIGEGYSFAKSISDNSKNPADHQALIYALAKALDPGSVVREGEYATVQKYAQSMAQSYGKSVSQAISGTGFLSSDAIRNIKATIGSRFTAAETSYKNLYSETERRVNLIGNTDKGNQLLNNYGGAFAPTASSSPVESAPVEEPTKSFWSKAKSFLFGN